MSAAVRGVWGAAVVAACAAPSAAANVWPRLTHMWAEGAASGTEVGITIALTLSAVGMTAVPFAMKKAGNLGFWLVCLLMGLGLATFNYSMAVDLASRFRDSMSSPAAVKQLEAAALDRRKTAATAALGQLPQLPHTTAAMVTAAQTAADAATASKEEECRRRGLHCRDREADQRGALAALGTAEANRANTAERERLNRELADATKERVKLGHVSDEIDPGAAKIGKLLAKFVDMGPRPDLVVLDWWPTFVAIMIEAIGLLLPRIILTATGHAEERPARSWRWREPATEIAKPARAAPIAAPSAAVTIAAPRPTAATAARPKTSKKINTAAVGDAESVRQWFKSRTVPRPGSKLKPKAEVYEGSYVRWCAEQTPPIEPVSFTAFGNTIKAPVEQGGCGIVLESTPEQARLLHRHRARGRSEAGRYRGMIMTGPSRARARVGATSGIENGRTLPFCPPARQLEQP